MHVAHPTTEPERLMRLDTPRARLDLRHNDVATLRHACRTRLDVLEGVAWVTIDRDPRDIVLTRGQSFMVDSSENVIVNALQGDAVVDVLAPGRAVECKPARRARRGAWSDRVRGFFFGGWQPRTA
jgi:hypothetical protein